MTYWFLTTSTRVFLRAATALIAVLLITVAASNAVADAGRRGGGGGPGGGGEDKYVRGVDLKRIALATNCYAVVRGKKLFITHNPFMVKEGDELLCVNPNNANGVVRITFSSGDMLSLGVGVKWLTKAGLSSSKAKKLVADSDRNLAVTKHYSHRSEAVELLLPGGLTEREALKLLNDGASFSRRFFRLEGDPPKQRVQTEWSEFFKEHSQGSRLTPYGVTKMIKGNGPYFTLADLYQMLEASFSRSQLRKIIGRKPL